MAKMLQYGYVVYIDIDTQAHRLLNFFKRHTVGGKEDFTGLKASVKPQVDFLYGNGIKPAAHFAKQLHDIQVAIGLASIFYMQIGKGKSLDQALVLPGYGFCAIYV
jgi:hypothetical protein